MSDFELKIDKPIEEVLKTHSTNSVMPESEITLTFGEALVGLTFNPSNDPSVQRAKELCAELADLMNKKYHNPNMGTDRPLYETLFQHAIGEILNAQMSVVKVLTFKY
jgi:hypothetical protein